MKYKTVDGELGNIPTGKPSQHYFIIHYSFFIIHFYRPSP